MASAATAPALRDRQRRQPQCGLSAMRDADPLRRDIQPHSGEMRSQGRWIDVLPSGLACPVSCARSGWAATALSAALLRLQRHGAAAQ